MAFAVFPAVVDQSVLVCGQVRPQFGQPPANLVDRRLAGIRFRSHYVNIDSVVKATQSDAGSVQVAVPDFPLRAIQVMPVSRQPVFEIVNMRKIDEAFSDSLKTPGNVIPIQDVDCLPFSPTHSTMMFQRMFPPGWSQAPASHKGGISVKTPRFFPVPNERHRDTSNQ
jgi:hypothetical protein